MPKLREPDKTLLMMIARYITQSEMGEPCEHVVAWLDEYMKEVWGA